MKPNLELTNQTNYTWTNLLGAQYYAFRSEGRRKRSSSATPSQRWIWWPLVLLHMRQVVSGAWGIRVRRYRGSSVRRQQTGDVGLRKPSLTCVGARRHRGSSWLHGLIACRPEARRLLAGRAFPCLCSMPPNYSLWMWETSMARHHSTIGTGKLHGHDIWLRRLRCVGS
jgi:hypothetical protein